jgi:hypothetical protein
MDSVIKGNSQEDLQNEAQLLANLLRREVEAKSGCPVYIGIGTPQQHLGDLPHSFAEEVEQVKTLANEAMTLQDADKAEKSELLKLDRSVLENYLKSGDAQEFDAFFRAYIRPLDDAVHAQSGKPILVEIVLTTIQFMRDLLENPEQLMATIFDREPLLIATEDVDQFTEVIRRIITSALLLRDSQVGHERAKPSPRRFTGNIIMIRTRRVVAPVNLFQLFSVASPRTNKPFEIICKYSIGRKEC